MSSEVKQEGVLKGGEFIIKDSDHKNVYIPEDINEEQKMIAQMCEDFVLSEIYSKVEDIESLKEGAANNIVEKMGEIGILGAHMPSEYGGMELDTNTNTIISEKIGPSGSMAVAFAAHIGIGMLPIFYFGTDDQKSKYLPKLATGELKASYCLTEPDSGSDALAAKTKAILSDDGKHYLLTGQKMWITNAGFADVFIVFAQIDGDKFTGFIVDKETEGLSLGEEEPKMGIKGSSTRQVFFDNAKVPVDNVLGEIGKGHHIAFNVLNIGRFKLGALCLGGSKMSCQTAIQYANERHQFGQPIGNFGAIKTKLAEQAIKIFALESAQYRVSDLMQKAKSFHLEEGSSFSESTLKAAEDYSIECSILKVAGSEVLDFVVDETVQVHGGIGFSEEYTAARAYRDSRINRIYEGTNEINRLLMVDMLFRKAMKGHLDLVGPAWDVQKELSSMPSMEKLEGSYAAEKKAIKDFKKIALMVAGAAAKKQMDGELNLKEEQEVVMNVSDILIDTFMAESLLLRVLKLSENDLKSNIDIYNTILRQFCHDAQARIQKYATDALGSFADGDLLKVLTLGLKRFTKYPIENVKVNRRQIADYLLQANKYSL